MNRDNDTRSRLWAIRPWHIVIVLLCIMMIAFGALRVARRVRLHNRVEAVRAKGHPVTLAELNTWHQTPISGQNGADYVMQALARLQVPRDQEKEQIPILGQPSLPSRTQAIDDRTASTIGKLLDDNTEALDLVRQATGIKRCRYTLDFTLGDNVRVPHVGKFRDMAGLLCLKEAPILPTNGDDNTGTHLEPDEC
jgi:hypothetical protein